MLNKVNSHPNITAGTLSSVNLVDPIRPIPTLFHPFSAIISIQKDSEMYLDMSSMGMGMSHDKGLKRITILQGRIESYRLEEPICIIGITPIETEGNMPACDNSVLLPEACWIKLATSCPTTIKQVQVTCPTSSETQKIPCCRI